MEIYTSHQRLFVLAFFFFVTLAIFVAIIPAVNSQDNNAPLPGSQPLTQLEAEGKDVFISEGCVACHTQQVRNVAMDKTWGIRPSIAADYARNTRIDTWTNTATLMGSERTGPDLTNIGNRQPGADWHLLHLYNPRSVVSASVMPSYPWLFSKRESADMGEVQVAVPEAFRNGFAGKIVASPRALALVAYLQSLKQVPLPSGKPVPAFLYGKDAVSTGNGDDGSVGSKPQFDGAALYAANCQACHQENGMGLAGAFPALKASKIVLDADPSLHVIVIMNGYDGRVSEGYGIMPAVGTSNNLTPEEVAAIVNHERVSWGNRAKKVTTEEVKKIIALLKTTN